MVMGSSFAVDLFLKAYLFTRRFAWCLQLHSSMNLLIGNILFESIPIHETLHLKLHSTKILLIFGSFSASRDEICQPGRLS